MKSILKRCKDGSYKKVASKVDLLCSLKAHLELFANDYLVEDGDIYRKYALKDIYDILRISVSEQDGLDKVVEDKIIISHKEFWEMDNTSIVDLYDSYKRFEFPLSLGSDILKSNEGMTDLFEQNGSFSRSFRTSVIPAIENILLPYRVSLSNFDVATRHSHLFYKNLIPKDWCYNCPRLFIYYHLLKPRSINNSTSFRGSLTNKSKDSFLYHMNACALFMECYNNEVLLKALLNYIGLYFGLYRNPFHVRNSYWRNSVFLNFTDFDIEVLDKAICEENRLVPLPAFFIRLENDLNDSDKMEFYFR